MSQTFSQAQSTTLKDRRSSIAQGVVLSSHHGHQAQPLHQSAEHEAQRTRQVPNADHRSSHEKAGPHRLRSLEEWQAIRSVNRKNCLTASTVSNMPYISLSSNGATQQLENKDVG